MTLTVPVLAGAQSTIAGEARDATGAVLPGVTVEAASEALIEKVRTATTDRSGTYRIVDLRPGVYTVTFSLPGFAIFRQERVALPAEFTATVNAELKVGALPPLSFELPNGECLAVEGPSGSGKSRLLRAIADLDPSPGYVYLDAIERGEMSAPDWRKRVRYVATEPGWWAAKIC